MCVCVSRGPLGTLFSINQITQSGQGRGFYIPNIYERDGKLVCVCACVTIPLTKEFQNCGHPPRGLRKIHTGGSVLQTFLSRL